MNKITRQPAGFRLDQSQGSLSVDDQFQDSLAVSLTFQAQFYEDGGAQTVAKFCREFHADSSHLSALLVTPLYPAVSHPLTRNPFPQRASKRSIGKGRLCK